MPTYEYFCPDNGREVTVLHAMSVRANTRGELCAMAELEVRATPRDTPVQRKIGAGLILTRRPSQLPGGGGGGATCCGKGACCK